MPNVYLFFEDLIHTNTTLDCFFASCFVYVRKCPLQDSPLLQFTFSLMNIFGVLIIMLSLS